MTVPLGGANLCIVVWPPCLICMVITAPLNSPSYTVLLPARSISER